ncbi:glutathione S-transferase family protein [Rhizobiaceae bacterium n13]|uniref:Glutathione S-transferase family protein n=1 Tax=Ferirhizobium litorale TaxID=2927786 RepID=A0AAE3U070_9HYPH|nr:glutathione S-transferase C-terminal domain-containing protein [Fererhizobium litorale]MDI7864831.1 glutathione S-transferase family protein [Fererhizobium litorale]MDI7921759.1 glutathione S-transferase family protein [Fererhizobium litorale]
MKVAPQTCRGLTSPPGESLRFFCAAVMALNGSNAMDEYALKVLLEKARHSIRDKARATEIRQNRGVEPGRFILFHAAMSFCSQKVRATLAQKGITFESNEMLILGSRDPATGALTPAENFAPDYVRLRLRGGSELGLRLVEDYSGLSSVSTIGLDACAVPTLVDVKEGKVIVDSIRICMHIDQAVPGSSPLVPADATKLLMMQRQLHAVDVTPHPALLYGFHPEDDARPELLKQAMVPVYDDKVEALERLVAENRDDADLLRAYEAKIAKEKGGKAVRHDAQFQHAVRGRARETLLRLAQDLEASRTAWLCGPEITLADLFWAVSLVRLTYLGLDTLWRDLPSVRNYYLELVRLPAIKQEVIRATIESMPASSHLAM